MASLALPKLSAAAIEALPPRELEAEARRRLDPAVYDFFAGGAGDEVTLRENEAAFARLGLLPRVLRGGGEPQLDLILLGCQASMPVLIAPTAFHRLAHPDGERATARAAASARTIMVVSMAATAAVEEIAAAAREASPEPDLWFQLYVQPDLGFTEYVVRRAEASGCTALVVSVDSPAFGRRERDLRHGFVELPEGMCCENMREPSAEGKPGPPRSISFWPELSWQHIDWLRSTTTLPIALKGVTHPEDARLAVRSGVDALIVSNHGGRQLDTVPATIELLPEVADAVEGAVPLLLDGGIRRGTDVVKALALGASAVAVGRPVLWGLAVAGESGVTQVLEQLRSELAGALALCGCTSLETVEGRLVRRRGAE
jgi:4-hydroxymandelate oxidase